MKIHFRDIRLFVNAGMSFSFCCNSSISDSLLDTNKSQLETTGNIKEVTCKNCLKKIQKECRK